MSESNFDGVTEAASKISLHGDEEKTVPVTQPPKGKYIPPHLRNRPPPSVGPGAEPSSTAPPTTPATFRAESTQPSSSFHPPSGGTGFRGGFSRTHVEQRAPRWGDLESSGPSLEGTRMGGRWGGDSPFSKKSEPAPTVFNGMNTGINFDRYDNIPAEVSGRDPPPEIETFEKSGLHPRLLKNIVLANYTKPTPVQKNAISIICNGRDLMVSAQTGSGKTAAFLLPTLHKMLEMGARPQPPVVEFGGRRVAYPTTLILAPTRELASQIYDESRKFCHFSGIQPVVVYGGADIRDQLRQIDRGCDLIVACPGRLVDLIERGRISLELIRFLILDEADRMLDMGFEPQIRQIVQDCGMPRKGSRQTLMFSATFPKEIQRLASDFLEDYIFLAIGRVGSTTDFIRQRVEFVEEPYKREFVLGLLNQVSGLTLVFVETKRGADALEMFLIQQGYPATSIHGDRTQQEREAALRSFKMGRTPILVATDVAARGLDIPNVTHVINYDVPNDIDDYVHRIGRTGRAGNNGLATALVNEKNKNILRDLLELLQEAGQEIPPFLHSMASFSAGGTSGRGRKGRFGGRDYRRDDRGGGGGGSWGGPPPRSSGGYGGNSGGYGSGSNYGGSYGGGPPFVNGGGGNFHSSW